MVSCSKSYSYSFLSWSVVTKSPEDMMNWESRDVLSLQGAENLLEETESKWEEVSLMDSPKEASETDWEVRGGFLGEMAPVISLNAKS